MTMTGKKSWWQELPAHSEIQWPESPTREPTAPLPPPYAPPPRTSTYTPPPCTERVAPAPRPQEGTK